jgi:hypothetical protein
MLYSLFCNNRGFYLQSRYVEGNSLEDSGFIIEYELHLDRMISNDFKYAAIGYYKGLPTLIYGRYGNFFTLIWLKCTPKEAYDAALTLKISEQKTLSLFFTWVNGIMDPVLATFKDIPFIFMTNRQSIILKKEMIEHATDVIRDYYEQKTGGLVIRGI